MVATNNSFVEVFAGSRWEAEVVKGLLEANGVQSLFKDETLGSVTSPYLGVGGVVKILVDEADRQLAVRLISDSDAVKKE